MPDRDEFAHLPRRLRSAAQAYVAAARRQPFANDALAEGLDELFSGGVASLPAQLACWQALTPEAGQTAFTDATFRRQDLDAIDAVAQRHGANQLDGLLARELQRSVLAGAWDLGAALRNFVGSVVDHVIVYSKRGVLGQSPDADLGAARTAVAPLIAETAARLLRRPDLKRLGLANELRRPFDLHADNLLPGEL